MSSAASVPADTAINTSSFSSAPLQRHDSSSSSSSSSYSSASSTTINKPYEPEGMSRVKHLHHQLLGVVGTLNEKVGAVLEKQEKEFLRAYRAHMYGVQKELTMLRAKADDAAIQLAKNEKIRSLENERDWYRSEAVRLDEFTTQLKTDVTYLHERMSALEDDRAWFEKAAKASERKNRILQAKLQGLGPNTVLGNSITVTTTIDDNTATKFGSTYTSTTGNTLSSTDALQRKITNFTINPQETDRYNNNEENDVIVDDDLFYRNESTQKNSNGIALPSSSAKTNTVKGLSSKSKSKKMELPNKHPSMNPAHIAAVTAGITGAVQVLNNSTGTPVGSGPRAAMALSSQGSKSSPTKGTVDNYGTTTGLQNQVQELMIMNKRLLRRLTELEHERSESENILVACIQETKKEILRRRTRAGGSPPSSPSRTGRSISPLNGNSSSTTTTHRRDPSVGIQEKEITGEHHMNQALETERSQRVHSEQFTRTDKRALLIQFLQDDRVLDRLIELL